MQQTKKPAHLAAILEEFIALKYFLVDDGKNSSVQGHHYRSHSEMSEECLFNSFFLLQANVNLSFERLGFKLMIQIDDLIEKTPPTASSSIV